MPLEFAQERHVSRAYLILYIEGTAAELTGAGDTLMDRGKDPVELVLRIGKERDPTDARAVEDHLDRVAGLLALPRSPSP